MEKEVIFKTFRTYAYPYLYDRHTNSLVSLTEEEYCELRNVETGIIPWQQSTVVRHYQENGLLLPNIVETIEHPSTQIIEQYITTRMNQLILQVTQQCNLRCSYCTYSGNYEGNRTHSSSRMEFKTAKKAIDFFLNKSSSMANVIIGFYGGEPLLEFELIKKCVAYVKANVEGKNIKFTMTTNGTLLNDEIIDFLVENDFILAISLDGPEKEHDANRKFSNGIGSFSTIIKNIGHIREKNPEYAKKITIATTINPHADLGCVLEYFGVEKIFSDKHILFNPMKETLLNHEARSPYSSNYYMIRNYEYIKELFTLVGKLDSRYISPLMRNHENRIKSKIKSLHGQSILSKAMHHGGPCLPGVQRLFVRTDGILYPCERVNENVDFFKIGSLDDGLDIEKIRAILNIGKVTEDNCKKCWNIFHCSICSSQIEFTDSLTTESKLDICEKSCSASEFDLHEICVLNEFGYNG